MRAADFSWEAPPSPVKTTISSTAIIALLLRNKRRSVPPKESNACLSKSARGCLPQSLHSPQLSEPDPIYPYLPFLFCPSFGNDRAIFPLIARTPLLRGFEPRMDPERGDLPPRIRTRSVQHGPYNRTIIARSR